MPIHKTEFVQSNTDYKNCPPADRPEYAFIGRSNVGKSSLINMLTGNSKLAKVSSKPGKTRLLNHFLIDNSWYLVDLPGYGWAQVSKTERESMHKMNSDYLKYRPNLFCTFLLIDSRLELQAVDHEFMIWLGENQIPFAIVFTKTDKQGQTKNKLALEKYKEMLLQTWEHLPPIFLTSSSHHTGREELLEYIFKLNKEFTLK